MRDALKLFVPITKVDEAQRLVYGAVTREEVDAAGEILDYETAKAAFQEWSNQQHIASGGKSYGNMRAMHGAVAAGKFVEPLEFDDDGKTVLAVGKVVDESEWAKVVEGVYTGFSIGGSYAARWADPDQPAFTRYTPTIAEISIVDNPCVRSATFDVVRANGAVEVRKFKTGAQNMAKHNQADVVETSAQAVEVTKENNASVADQAESHTGEEFTENETTVSDQVAKAATVNDVVQVWKAKDGSTHLTKKEAQRRNAEIEVEEETAPALKAANALGKALGVEDAETSAVSDAAGTSSPEDGNSPAAEEAKPEAAAAEVVEGEMVAVAEKAAAAPAKKAVGELALTKSLYDVTRCADILCDLKWLKDCMESDKMWDDMVENNPDSGADAALIVEVKAALGVISDLLVSIVGHEVAEINKAAGEAEGDVTPLEKALHQNSALKKVIDGFGETMSKFAKRLEAIEQQPQPAKGAVRVVAKGADTSNGVGAEPANDLVEQMAKLSQQEQAQIMIKAALRNPQHGAPR